MKIAAPIETDLSGNEKSMGLSTKALGKSLPHAAESGQTDLFPLLMAEKTAEVSISSPPHGGASRKTDSAIAAGYRSIEMGRPSLAGADLRQEEGGDAPRLLLPGMGETIPSALRETGCKPKKGSHSLESSEPLPVGTAAAVLLRRETAAEEIVDASDPVALPHRPVQESGGSAAESNFPGLRNGIAGKQGDGVPAFVLPETASAEVPEKGAFARHNRAVAGPVHREPQGQNAATDLYPATPEEEVFLPNPKTAHRPADQKTLAPASDAPPDFRNGIAGKQRQGVSASVPEESASIADEAKKALFLGVDDADAAINPIASGQTASAEAPEKAAFARYAHVVAGPVHGEPQGQNASTDLHPATPEEEVFLPNPKTAHRPADQKTLAPASDAPQVSHAVLHRPVQKNGRLEAENNPPDLRNGIAGKQGQGVSASVPEEPASIAGEAKKALLLGVDDADAAINPIASRHAASAEAPENAAFARYARAVAGPVHEEPQGQNAATDLQTRMPGQESFPVATEAGTRMAHLKTQIPASDGFDLFHAQAVIDQIIEAQKAMNGDIKRVRIMLAPPNLGTLNLDILLRRKRMEIVMTADNIGLQQALQSRAEDIRIALQRQDFKVEGFQVLLQDNAANQQQGRGEAMFQKHNGHQNGQQKTEVPLTILPVSQMFERAAGSKGMVSIFV